MAKPCGEALRGTPPKTNGPRAWPIPVVTSGPVELPYSDNVNVLGVVAHEVRKVEAELVVAEGAPTVRGRWRW